MKTLQSNFTTPELSKRLLELGVPADSADCIFTRFSRDEKWKRRFIEDIVSAQLFCNQDFYLPCWSAGRLMEIIRICNLTAEKPWVYIERDNIHAMITAITDGVNNRMLDLSKLEE